MKNNVPRIVMSEALKHVKLLTDPDPENLLSLKEGMADENIGQIHSKIGSVRVSQHALVQHNMTGTACSFKWKCNNLCHENNIYST